MAFDQGNIYVAARLYDSSPEGIISLLGRRDAEVESDWFVFAVDPYYDKRSGFQFAVNPAGAIQDGTLFNDEGIDMTWDGIWEYASRCDDQGWTFLDRDRTWVITGWVGGTTVSGTQESISRLQLSSLHYYQRPDVDYVDFNPNATTLNGWAGRIFVNKQKGSLVFNTAIGAMSPGFHAVDLGYHTRGDVINGHVEAGYQSYHPGKVFRTWMVTFATYRSYDFGGIRTDEYYILNATAQLLNYWSGNLNLSYDPNRTSHYLTRGGPLAAYPWGASIRASISSDNRRRVVFGLFGRYRDHPFGAYNYSFGASSSTNL